MKVTGMRTLRLIPRKDRTAAVPAGRRGGVSSPRRAPRSVAASAAARVDPTQGRQEQAGLTLALRTVVEDLPPDEITDFIQAVTGSDAHDGLDPSMWGPPPSATEAARAHLVNLTAKFADRQAVLAHSITRAEAAQLLGISDQAVSDRLAAGDLVGLKDGRVWRLPAWQFDADTENGWLPGIAELRRQFPVGPVTLTGWVTAPNVDLEDRTPAARLAAGDVDRVLRAAHASGPAAW